MAVEVPRLLVVADVDAAGGEEAWLRVLRRLRGARPEVPVAVQVRAKGRPVVALRQLARQAQLALEDAFPLVLNGPAGLARELGFWGVHWPEADLPQAVPAGAGGLVRSCSVHSPQAVRKVASLVHYALFGPVFPPFSKQSPAVGLEALREACGAGVPLLAVGGLTADRVRDCLRAGAAGVAVVSAVLRAEDPAAAVARLARRLAEG